VSLAEELERLALALQMLAPNDANYFARRHAIICGIRDLAAKGERGGRRWWASDKAGAS
jgi:hypothetical protein